MTVCSTAHFNSVPQYQWGTFYMGSTVLSAGGTEEKVVLAFKGLPVQLEKESLMPRRWNVPWKAPSKMCTILVPGVQSEARYCQHGGGKVFLEHLEN